MGATGKIHMATDVRMDGRKYMAEPYNTSDITVFYNGFYYIDKRDLQLFEFNKSLESISIDRIYPVERSKRNYANYIHPLPDDYINDNPLEYVYFAHDIKVNKSDLIVYCDDLIKLFPKESPCFEKSPKTSSPKENPKANESLMKMVLAMAIKGYCFNPDDKKSKTPAEIVADVQELGISIDADTVRKWLKEAAALLPRDEKSD